MKIALCQISGKLINPNKSELEREYFDAICSKPGWYQGEDFWEIPLWIAKASASIPDAELVVVRDIEKAIKTLAQYDVVMFSVMESNKKIIADIVAFLPENVRVILGGYVGNFISEFKAQAEWFDTLKGGIESLAYIYNEGSISYKLFAGQQTIPRLTMSTGCYNQCKFCSIEKTVVEESTESIKGQIEAFKDLRFEYVYLNDKTFGQAENSLFLPYYTNLLGKKYPNFKGFIIQTTPRQFERISGDFLRCSKIKFVELGIESYNDDILKRLNKTSSIDAVDVAISHARKSGIKIIPNIMVGLSGKIENEFWMETVETYRNTIDFLMGNEDIISHVNVYTLALYKDTKSTQELGNDGNTDGDENIREKSWLSGNYHEEFYQHVLKFGLKQIKREGGRKV